MAGLPAGCGGTRRASGIARGKPTFSFDVTDTLAPHDVFWTCATGDYPFSNLYTFVKLDGPGGMSATDTVECTLADPPAAGTAKGSGSSAATGSRRMLYKLRNRFPGPAVIRSRWNRPCTEKLEGIIGVGVSVERSKAK